MNARFGRSVPRRLVYGHGRFTFSTVVGTLTDVAGKNGISLRRQRQDRRVQSRQGIEDEWLADEMGQGCSTLNTVIGQEPVEADGVVVKGGADVGLSIVSQEVQGEVAQQGKDAGISADAAGVLAQGDIEHMMKAVFDGPMAADDLS